MAMLIAVPALAQTTVYWDRNGSTAGAGSSPDGSWSTSNGAPWRSWSTNAAGTGNPGRWTQGDHAVFSAGSDATGSYTVTLSETIQVDGITVQQGNPTFTGNTLEFTGSSPLFSVASGSTATVASQISGSNGLTKAGAGLLALSNNANNWSGGLTISAGTVRADTTNALPTSSAVTIGSTGTLLLNWGASQTVDSLAGSGSLNIRGNTFTVGDSTNTVFSGTISDDGAYGTIIKLGTGTLTLAGSSTYSGVTHINSGAVVVAGNNAFGNSTWGNTVANGAALHLQGGISLNEGSFTVTGSGLGGTGALRNLSGDNTLTTSLTLGGATVIQSDAGRLGVTGSVALGGNTLTVGGAGNVTLNGAVNNGSITRTGTGTLTLAGTTANSFSGTLAINNGTVDLAKTAGTTALNGGAVLIGDGVGAAGSATLRLLASDQIANNSHLTLAADGLLDLNGFSETIDRISGTGLIDLSSSGALSVGVNSGNSSFGGTIIGDGSLTKLGWGTLTFESDLAFNGTVFLNKGTLVLGGNDLNFGTLHVTDSAVIDFGGNSILSLGNLIIDAGATLSITNWVDTLDFFTAQNWTGAVTDTRGESPMNRIVFTGFDGNDTQWQGYDNQITPVPEPSTYGAIFVGLALAGLYWHRRRQVSARI